MNSDCLKLTIYLGERDRVAGGFLADELLAVFGRHELATSVLLRGTEGFGAGHRLQTQRLLTLSEDLPLVAVAVDTRERIEAALPEIALLAGDRLLTLERARLLSGSIDGFELPSGPGEQTKLTVYCGRQARVGGRGTHEAVVELLHRHRIAGATVLLGVDGTVHGARRRARFLGRNTDVPLMIISVGEGSRIAAAMPELGALLQRPLATLERVEVCKRDGELLRAPSEVAAGDGPAPAARQKLMIYAGEQARHEGRPLYVSLVRRLRERGAAGATSLRGLWGYHGDHAPHGDTLWSVRRHLPVVTVIVDTPANIGRWFAEVVDPLTSETGLVTSELVPAFEVAKLRPSRY